MKTYVTKPLKLIALLVALSPGYLLAEDSFICDKAFNLTLPAHGDSNSSQRVSLAFGEQGSRDSGLKHCGEIQVTSDTPLQTNFGEFDFTAPGVEYEMWSVFDHCDRYCHIFASRQVTVGEGIMMSYLIFVLLPYSDRVEVGISPLTPVSQAHELKEVHWFPGTRKEIPGQFSGEWF